MIGIRTRRVNGIERRDTSNLGEQFLPELDPIGLNPLQDTIALIDPQQNARKRRNDDPATTTGKEGRRTGGIRRTMAGMTEEDTRTTGGDETMTRKCSVKMIGEAYTVAEEVDEGRRNSTGIERTITTGDLGTNLILRGNLSMARIS